MMKKVGAKQAESRAEIMKLLVRRVEDVLCNLYNRWQDEKENEDFSDYEKVMSDMVDHGFVKGTKRPFGFIVQMDGFPYRSQVFVNSRCISWKSV